MQKERFMQILNVILSTLGSIIVLFILTKLMGNKQMSQLSMFDYINGITIGSIAAEMATSLESDFWLPLVAMVLYAFSAFTISVATCKSMRLRKILSGKPLIIFHNGRFNQKNLFKAKLDINEFLMICRNNGYFNLADIYTAMLEPNGKFSFIPAARKRPTTAEDLNLFPSQEDVLVNVIIDGVVMEKNLHFTGNNRIWLQNQLNAQGFNDVTEISLATCDTDNSLSVYRRVEKENTKDVTE